MSSGVPGMMVVPINAVADDAFVRADTSEAQKLLPPFAQGVE